MIRGRREGSGLRKVPGKRWTAGQVSAAGYGSIIGVLALGGAAAHLGIGAAQAHRAPIDRTHQVLDTMSNLRGQLQDAQRGERGFVLTADEHYLQPFTSAAVQVPQTLARLRQLFGADTAQQPMLDDLQASATATVDYLGLAVTQLQNEGFRDARPDVLGTAGTETLDRAEQILDALRHDQLTVLRAQEEQAQSQETLALWLATAALAAAAGIAMTAWRATRSVTQAVAAGPAPAPGPVAASAPAEVETEVNWHTALRVLLAEDDPVNQKVAQFMLGKLGHRVDTVANGLEAVQALRAADYDVVLMDVQMPILDGLEATRLIRSEFPADRQPHIIAMTASVLAEDRAACRTAGMNDYLPKPVRLPELTSALTPLLLDFGHDEPADDAVTATPLGVHREAEVRARLADISDGEPSGPERTLLARLLRSFTTGTPGGLDRLAELITAGDVPGVRSQAHALNGSASNIGAGHLAGMFAAVETDARAGRLPKGPATMTAIRAEYAAVVPVCELIADELSLAATH
ncbi:response regulator [Actinoplanes sp. NPDC020271]|uniref:response regulator n=1 Tax=Actinoplanes sp. NPDC020271 TaxID=3363896 RepID=UPI0037B2E6F1